MLTFALGERQRLPRCSARKWLKVLLQPAAEAAEWSPCYGSQTETIPHKAWVQLTLFNMGADC